MNATAEQIVSRRMNVGTPSVGKLPIAGIFLVNASMGRQASAAALIVEAKAATDSLATRRVTS